MIIDRTHLGWIVAVLILAVVASAAYVPYSHSRPNGPSGSSPLGLVFGITGSALMLFAGLLSARKKLPVWPLGRAETWLKAHIWLGLLAVPLILFHAGGFRSGGPLTTLLMIFFYAEILSGIAGALVQHFLPRWMRKQVARETIYEQIDHVLAMRLLDADAKMESLVGPLGLEPPVAAAESAALAAQQSKGSIQPPIRLGAFLEGAIPGSERLRQFYLEQVRPFLANTKFLLSRLSDETAADQDFAAVRQQIPADENEMLEVLDEIEAVCAERRDLALQKKMHHWLHGWLYFHVPVSVILLVLATFHAVMALSF